MVVLHHGRACSSRDETSLVVRATTVRAVIRGVAACLIIACVGCGPHEEAARLTPTSPPRTMTPEELESLRADQEIWQRFYRSDDISDRSTGRRGVRDVPVEPVPPEAVSTSSSDAAARRDIRRPPSHTSKYLGSTPLAPEDAKFLMSVQRMLEQRRIDEARAALAQVCEETGDERFLEFCRLLKQILGNGDVDFGELRVPLERDPQDADPVRDRGLKGDFWTPGEWERIRQERESWPRPCPWGW